MTLYEVDSMIINLNIIYKWSQEKIYAKSVYWDETEVGALLTFKETIWALQE